MSSRMLLPCRYLRRDGWICRSVICVCSEDAERERTDWHGGAEHNTQDRARCPRQKSTVSSQHIPQVVHFHHKAKMGLFGSSHSHCLCLSAWICKHRCRRADLCHTQKARVSASCLKESWDFDKTDGQAPLAPEKVSYAPRASGRGNLLRPVVAPTRTKKSCSSSCHLSLSNSTANNMSLCWGGGEQSEGEKKGRLKYAKNSLQRF